MRVCLGVYLMHEACGRERARVVIRRCHIDAFTACDRQKTGVDVGPRLAQKQPKLEQAGRLQSKSISLIRSNSPADLSPLPPVVLSVAWLADLHAPFISRPFCCSHPYSSPPPPPPPTHTPGPVGLVGNASALRVRDLGSLPALSVGSLWDNRTGWLGVMR